MSYSASPDGSLDDVRRSIAAAREEAEELVRTGAPSPAPPDSVPGYTILREIGRGGMGVVYETEQRQPQRTVALKVMSAGETADVHRLPLFLQEVQTLARLNHPGIAGIYGAGCTDDGRPYFAMELVRGQRLVDYVRSRQLAVRDRLRLFQRVCEAVHYAHQRGVIHRDLKPSNISVDAAGHPKVLDFGLAGLTDPDGTLRHSPSDVGRIVGTRLYMSPEQARGRPDEIDVRTDVYALGVILYELLTDALPYDVPPGDRDDAWPAVYQQPFRRPSAVRRLPRDLDWIVLKTLASDPAQRYQSVAALGEDLERLLTGRPIQARAPSALYLLRKWVARHRAAAAYLASLAGLVIAFGVWVGHMDAEASRQQLFEKDRQLSVARFRLDMTKQHQRELAVIERERDTARQIQRFWENLVVPAGRPGEVSEAGVRTFLDQAARRVESELSGPPEAAAAIYDTLGLGYASRTDDSPEALRRP
jgi:non-specific serine/threonine protein kinase/serine/threonine-protein kinase